MSERSGIGICRLLAGVCLLLLCITLLGACSPRVPVVPPVTLDAETPPEVCVDEGTGAEMSYAEAVRVAEQSACVQEGPLTQTRACNAGTGTWWIDLDVERAGCAPACVVDINTGTADIEWRCTGLLTPEAETPAATPEAEPTEAPTEMVTATETPAPSDTEADPDSPPSTATLDPDIEWGRYTNETYGFSFHYPLSWSIELLENRPETDNRANAVRLTRDNVQLLIEYRQPDEDAITGPADLPEGEVTEQGTVALLDRVLPKYVLEQEEREIIIFVGEQYVDLELYIEMRVTGTEGAAAGIPEEAHADFDRIIATFVRTGAAATDPYSGWATYTQPENSATPTFAFRYPPDWALDQAVADEEDVLTVDLRNETLLLRFQVRQAGSESTFGSDTASSELVAEAGAVSFLGSSALRHVEVEGDRLKKVFVSHRDDAIEVYVTLSADTAQVPDAEIDLPDSARQIMDQILASFTLSAN
jgi:hypothetical protein